ncbi:Six-hairpin glycosidase-like protein [Naematelia encephala]|uniref:Six-hairpin glycosidase-like protein n=1 Tax=Naematelia encephala TaxID=71784 RepID=A0A1Y2B8A0_9TREE|nr:Six-hairpin glycosidase-like protein [Naematelia encephala]
MDWHLLGDSVSQAFSVSTSIKVVEAAIKYGGKDGITLPTTCPEYTAPGGQSGEWICSPIKDSWTCGFLVGLLWLVEERKRLMPESVHPSYDSEMLVHLARRWQDAFQCLLDPAPNHDQGFRFQLSHGRDFAMTGSAKAKQTVISAADSLVDRYNPSIGCIRSWESHEVPSLADDPESHFLIIIDTMMNLDLLYQVSEMTFDAKYAAIATRQAEVCMKTHIRPDFTTYHVVDVNPTTGKVQRRFTHQGWKDESTWPRGQAWGIYGFAQCALRTGRQDFLDTSKKLADVFLAKLPPSGVPPWDFDHPRPTPYDASAGCVAARGMQMLYQLLTPEDPKVAERYLAAGFKLVSDILRECYTPEASLVQTDDGLSVNWGKADWEPILAHSTISGDVCGEARQDHGLIYADYYLLEFANEALKMKKGLGFNGFKKH